MKLLQNPLLFLAFLSVGFFTSCGQKTAEKHHEKTIGYQKTASHKTLTTIKRDSYAIAIHGGAGNGLLRENYSEEQIKAFRDSLNMALDIGENILKNGGTGLDAVVEVISFLENCPLFNAGKGAVFTNNGQNQLDASIMDGKTMNAGAVGGVTVVKNPIKAARAVMENSVHVLLTGDGANEFSKLEGLEIVDPSFFYTEKSWNALQRALESEKNKTGGIIENQDFKLGTVGVVALDNQGNLAARTSTGGMTNKRYGRLGDVPVIGAGTYANNNTCAVSCTGHGEFFIIYAVAHDLSSRLNYLNVSLKEAADYIINQQLKSVNGNGGLIAVDKNGEVTLPFNTKGMLRGYAKPGKRYVGIFGDE